MRSRLAKDGRFAYIDQSGVYFRLFTIVPKQALSRVAIVVMCSLTQLCFYEKTNVSLYIYVN